MSTIAFFVPHVGCPRQCVFCNQNTISGESEPATRADLVKTLDSAVADLKESVINTEIAFFGGSFTAIPKGLRSELLDTAKDYCENYGFKGIRFSTRPDCITENILEDIKKYPVNRIELGAQSMNNHVLDLNRRGHDRNATISASKLILKYGFKLTLQMMVGMYGDDLDGAVKTAEVLAELSPDEVRIYPTLVLKDTYLAELYLQGKYTPPSLDETIEVCSELLEFFNEKQIRVIRLGLHEEEGLKDSLVAGPHHPALGELCQGRLLAKKGERLLQASGASKGIIAVSPKDISKLKGHSGRALARLKAKGYDVDIKADAKISRGEVALIAGS